MTAARVVITQRAEEEIDAADLWWQTHRPYVPTAVRDEVAKAISLLAAQPRIGTLVPGTLNATDRKLVLRRISYAIYYRASDEIVEILRFWHTSRGTRPRL